MLLYPEGRVLLNDVAYEILHLCDGTREVPDMVHALSDKYSNISENDIYDFIDDSTDKLWFDPPSLPASPTPDVPPPTDSTPPSQ